MTEKKLPSKNRLTHHKRQFSQKYVSLNNIQILGELNLSDNDASECVSRLNDTLSIRSFHK